MAKYWKAIIAAVGMGLVVLNALAGQSLGFSPSVQVDINLALAVLTPISVYLKANAQA